MNEEAIHDFLEKECYTTPDVKDPSKPFIVEDGFVKPNLNFNVALAEREAEKRIRKSFGTSFFLNFDCSCDLHQLPGLPGRLMREKIMESLRSRFMNVLAVEISDPLLVKMMGLNLEMKIFPEPRPHVDNGEVYLWILGFSLKEDIVFAIMKGLKNSIKDNPIKVTVKKKKYEVPFYGWGFRQC